MSRCAGLAGVATVALVTGGLLAPGTAAGLAGGDHRSDEPDGSDEIPSAPTAVAEWEVAWTATTDGSRSREPATSGNGVHTVTDDGLSTVTAYSFDPATGQRQWATELDQFFLDTTDVAPLVFAHDVLWSGHGLDDGLTPDPYGSELLDPATGQVVAAAEAPGWVDGSSGDLYLVRREPVNQPARQIGLSAVVQDVNSADAEWQALLDVRDFRASWQPLTLGDGWVFQAGAGLLGSDGPGLVHGNALRGYSLDDQEECPGFEVLTCPTWVVELDGANATPAVLSGDGSDPPGQVVVTGTTAGTVHAVDAVSGDLLWSTPVGAAVRAAPALADDNVFVPTADGSLVVLDADTGDTLWSADVGGSVNTPPAVADDVVFAGAADGSVRAFPAAGCGQADCDPLWSDAVGSGISGGPVVDDGRLYVGTSDGRLIAYDRP